MVFKLHCRISNKKSLFHVQICAAALLVAVQGLPSPYIGYGVVPGGTQSTYHAQDELGRYSFGYQEPNQVRSETKDAFGVVRGTYRYDNRSTRPQHNLNVNVNFQLC